MEIAAEACREELRLDRRKIVSSGSLVGLLYVLMDEAIR